MLTPIVCMTCGLPLGDIDDLFQRARAARVRAVLARRDTAATQAAADAGLQIDCGDILLSLGVVKDCCRMHLVTNMCFCDYF
jgi:DNA-directed RNA polymerase subunit N (RpoN/RPB10)